MLICGTNLFSTYAYAAENSYSDVLDDLSQDSNFNASDYVANAGDYSLNVIQIAESVNKELFIYVYQPSGQSKNLTAASVSLSTTTGDNISPRVYSLSKLNSNGVFFKYKVNNFTVSTDSTRYYNIVEIWRKWDSLIDSETGNTVNEVTFAVGQLWKVITSGNVVTYSRTDMKYLEIKQDQYYTGMLRYANGWLGLYSVDRHYIAFTADITIDSVTSADVYFVTQSAVAKNTYNWETDSTLGDPVETTVTINSTDYDSNDPSYFYKKHTWNLIETASYFVENNDLKTDVKSNVENKQWVLSFLTTDYSETLTGFPGDAPASVTWTKVSSVTILRLNYTSEGTNYNVGVVMNKVTGSTTPGNTWVDQIGIDTSNQPDWMKLLAMILGLIVFVIILVLFFPLISPILSIVVKAVIWVVCLPFKLIGSLFRGHKK
jgi:hypothetical protein